MTYRDLAEFKQGLDIAASIKVGIQFSLAVARNRKTVAAELELLKDAIPEETAEFKEYTKQVNALQRLYAEAKEAKDNTRMEELNKNFADLQRDSKELVEKREEIINKYLDKEVKVMIHQVDIDELPQDIEASLLEKLSFMIKDF